MGSWTVRMTPEYVAGLVAGSGLGVAMCAVLEQCVQIEAKHLPMLGVVLAVFGGGLALKAQRSANLQQHADDPVS